MIVRVNDGSGSAQSLQTHQDYTRRSEMAFLILISEQIFFPLLLRPGPLLDASPAKIERGGSS